MIYVRISKDKIGAGIGVERQEKDCRALAKRLGVTVVAVFVDNDMSAYSGKPRKDYLAMLDYLRAGNVEMVLAWHTDRLHRSPVELEEYITVCEPRSVPTTCVKAGTLDLTTSMGRMQARIAGAVARQEVEHMSERIRGQKVDAAGNGKWLGGGRPFGYRLLFDTPEPPHKVIGVELDEPEAAAIRDAVRRVLAGETTYAVMKLWQATVPAARGGAWQAQNIRKVLCRAVNAGLTEHKGEIVGKSEWPAIISEDDFHAVRAILKDPSRITYPGVRSLKWVGSGVYRCGACGLDLRPASATNRDGSKRRIYRCRAGLAGHVNINAEPVDRKVIEAVCRVLDERGAGLIPDRNVEATKELHAKANTSQARLNVLTDMLGDGELTRAEFLRQRERITEKLAEVNLALESTRSGGVLDGVADAASPGAAFRDQPVARQRAIIDALVSVTVRPARKGLPRHIYDRVEIVPRP